MVLSPPLKEDSRALPLLTPGVISLALCPQVVSQTPQNFRSSETQASCDGCFDRQSICSVISFHSGLSRAVQYIHRGFRFHISFSVASSRSLWGWWPVWPDFYLSRRSSGGRGWQLPSPFSNWRFRSHRLHCLHGWWSHLAWQWSLKLECMTIWVWNIFIFLINAICIIWLQLIFLVVN